MRTTTNPRLAGAKYTVSSKPGRAGEGEDDLVSKTKTMTTTTTTKCAYKVTIYS